eukprot:TRINITY_DN17159_c0_g2_i1.p1 TRINITY_DN17159_c0_g2~~TRINITY_DN17159_c0_g2_i1.p1  ORF type:complete len:160 (-),score=12.07 TRINITY_DN17159_c0_g2_i1:567-1046(-)
MNASYSKTNGVLTNRFNRFSCIQESDKLSSYGNYSIERKELGKTIASRFFNKEFYKFNVGPGSYDPTAEALKTRIEFSFGRDSRLKRCQPSHSSAVGLYSPSHTITSKKSPRCFIGTAAKRDNYWAAKTNQRSPGPIYKYNVVTTRSTSNCAVSSFSEM